MEFKTFWGNFVLQRCHPNLKKGSFDSKDFTRGLVNMVPYVFLILPPPPKKKLKRLGDRFLSSAGIGKNCALSMRVTVQYQLPQAPQIDRLTYRRSGTEKQPKEKAFWAGCPVHIRADIRTTSRPKNVQAIARHRKMEFFVRTGKLRADFSFPNWGQNYCACCVLGKIVSVIITGNFTA